MFVKEWTVDKRGHLRVNWVKQERVSPLAYVATIEAAARTSDSIRRGSVNTGNQRPSDFSKSGKWNWIHSALQSFLP